MLCNCELSQIRINCGDNDIRWIQSVLKHPFPSDVATTLKILHCLKVGQFT